MPTMNKAPELLFYLIIAILVLIRGYYFIEFGPIYSNDSGGYESYALLLMQQTEQMSYMDLNWGHGLGTTTFRSIGYPAVLAFFMLISPDHFDWLVIGFQTLLSFYCGFLLYKLSFAFLQNRWISLFVFASYILSLGLVLDQSILTDSLSANLVLMMICHAGIWILTDKQLSWVHFLGLGMLMALSFFVREAGAILQYLMWPMILILIVTKHCNWKTSLVMFLAFVAPMFLSIQGYKAWNEYRTGESFVTTAARTTVYFPAFDMMKRGHDPFTGDQYLDGAPVTHEMLQTLSPNEIMVLVSKYVYEKHQMNAVEMARYGYKYYFKLWQQFPADMLRQTFKNIRVKAGFLAVMPIESYITLRYWSNWDLDSRPYSGTKDMKHKVLNEGRYDLALLYLCQSIFRLISFILFLGFTIGIPVIVIRRIFTAGLTRLTEVENLKVLTSLSFWVIFWGYVFAYALVHLELRYLLPVVPIGMIAGIYSWSEVRNYMKIRKFRKMAV
ncbi:hypothetical protein [Curvivirga sp.]|uniref:hypothetical protein n=1 Tax=Curvivirga sp. TaxID=2856848 RepID=UPI003B5B2EBD